MTIEVGKTYINYGTKSGGFRPLRVIKIKKTLNSCLVFVYYLDTDRRNYGTMSLTNLKSWFKEC